MFSSSVSEALAFIIEEAGRKHVVLLFVYFLVCIITVWDVSSFKSYEEIGWLLSVPCMLSVCYLLSRLGGYHITGKEITISSVIPHMLTHTHRNTRRVARREEDV